MNEFICPSGKEMYYERCRAKTCAKKLKRLGKGNTILPERKILRPYHCRLCGNWHLTSQKPKVRGQ